MNCNQKPIRYIVKVEISVYEDTDDLTDVFRTDIKAASPDKNLALNYAGAVSGFVTEVITNGIKKERPNNEQKSQ